MADRKPPEVVHLHEVVMKLTQEQKIVDNIYKQIAIAMKLQEVTQADIAKLIRRTQQSVSYAFKHKSFSLWDLTTICNYLHLSIEVKEAI